MEKNKIAINLNDAEKKILENIIQLDVLNSIRLYLTNIMLDGSILEEDIPKIDDFIIDWMTENEGQEIPSPLKFIQVVILGRAGGGVFDNPNILPPNTQIPSIGYPNQQLEPVIDEENMPTYLPKIYDSIEREVRRRVKIEMREYNLLLKKYGELKKKFEGLKNLMEV